MLSARSCSPDEMKIFCPEILYDPSSCGTAFDRSKPRSVPQCGSVRFIVPVHSQVDMRRSTNLIISSISTVGNYEYGFFWYLYLDGTIQMEVKLTGIVGVSAVAPDGATDTAPLIAPQLASPNHQHLFCFRLDFDLDGYRRLEDLGVTDLQVTPWTMPDTPAEEGVQAFMRQQPALSVKQDAIRGYADDVIAKLA